MSTPLESTSTIKSTSPETTIQMKSTPKTRTTQTLLESEPTIEMKSTPKTSRTSLTEQEYIAERKSTLITITPQTNKTEKVQEPDAKFLM